MNAIETQNLSREFEGELAVDSLNLTIPKGTVFGFLGPNGAGKTTTVRMLATLIAPTRGSATVCGFPLGQQDEAIRRHVGILTEAPGLYQTLSAKQNLSFFARLYGLSGQKSQQQIERYLRSLGLWERRNDIVSGFSKGMCQKIAIARALLHEPEIVFLDEPTSGLDPEATQTVRDYIREIKQQGKTIFLTTHNLPEADALCDLVGVFQKKLLRLDTPERLKIELFGGGTRVRLKNQASNYQEILERLPFVSKVTCEDEFSLSIRLSNPDEQTPIIVQTLCNAKAKVQFVGPVYHSLEDVYLRLVSQQNKLHEESNPL